MNIKSIKVAGMPVEQFCSSVAALEAHEPEPAIQARVTLTARGDIVELRGFYAALHDLTTRHGVSSVVSLSGRWDHDVHPEQLQLFGPPDDYDYSRDD